MAAPELREARAKQKSFKPRAMDSHPIAAIQKRVIDSEAFAALPASAVAVLLLYARNLGKDANGQVFVSCEDAERHGIERKTLYRSTKVLTSHGFLYPTTRGGNGVCTKYALTWLPLGKDLRGLRVDNFRPCAWRDWRPSERKNAGGKMSLYRPQKRVKTPESQDTNGQRYGDKKGHIEVNTNSQYEDPVATPDGDWVVGYLSRLAARGLSGRQCFMVPCAEGMQ